MCSMTWRFTKQNKKFGQCHGDVIEWQRHLVNVAIVVNWLMEQSLPNLVIVIQNCLCLVDLFHLNQRNSM